MIELVHSILGIDIIENNICKSCDFLKSLHNKLKKFIGKDNHAFQVCQIIHNILKSQEAAAINQRGNPFLWAMIDYFNLHEDLDIVPIILLLIFDAFLENLQEKFTIVIEISEECIILLPTTHIHLALNAQLYITKINNEHLIISKNEVKKSYFVHSRIRESIPVLTSTEIYNNILFTLLPLQYKDSLLDGVDFVCFETKIHQALSILKEAHQKLFERILSTIKFVIPLRSINSQGEKIYQSFSSYKLPGLIFISFISDPLWMLENIIHEYYHNELNMLMSYLPILKKGDCCYYSPWREDPRNTLGLFHAIYVSVGLAIFFNESSKMQNNSKFSIYCEKRLKKIMLQLEIALLQVNENDFTDKGKIFLNKIRNTFFMLFKKNSFDLVLSMESEIIEHVYKWKRNNPNNALNLKTPDSTRWLFA